MRNRCQFLSMTLYMDIFFFDLIFRLIHKTNFTDTKTYFLPNLWIKFKKFNERPFLGWLTWTVQRTIIWNILNFFWKSHCVLCFEPRFLFTEATRLKNCRELCTVESTKGGKNSVKTSFGKAVDFIFSHIFLWLVSDNYNLGKTDKPNV